MRVRPDGYRHDVPNQLTLIYLDDHWAAAGAGARLARRLADSNADSRWAEVLDHVADEIEDDERTLGEIRERLGDDRGLVSGGVGVAKRALAMTAEIAGRLKLNGRITTYSPLSRLFELEGLLAGVSAKQRLWAVLGQLHGADLPDVDFDGLVRRADEQLARLRTVHEEAIGELAAG